MKIETVSKISMLKSNAYSWCPHPLNYWGTFWSLKIFLRGVRVLLVLRGGSNMGELAKIGCKEGIQRYKIELYTCSFVLSYS